MGKDFLASKVYRLKRSFKLLFRLMPTKENKNKDIVKPYPRKILLKTLCHWNFESDHIESVNCF